MSFPRYPKYKQSGVEWLGEVPAHWGLMRLKRLTSCLDGKRVPLNSEQRSDKPGEVPYWGANAVMDYVDEALFDEELVLLGEDGAPFFDRTRSVAFRSTGPVWPNNHIHVLRPLPGVTAQFLVHCLNSTDYAEFIDGSTRDKLTQSQMGTIPIPCPTAEEQMAICNFLGVETARIDDLISEQEQLITLLKEKRQAVISHAVTKGLDPNVPMKDSGIEWLGEVPAHWEVKPLRHVIALIESGTSVNATDVPSEEGAFGVLKTSCVYSGEFNPQENKAVIPEEYDRVSCPLREGALIVSRMNTPELVGAAGLVRQARAGLFLPDRLWQVVMSPSVEPGFSHYWANSVNYRAQVEAACSGTSSSMQNLSQDQFKSFVISLPPASEQRAIIEFLARELGEVSRLIGLAHEGVRILRERRSALISAAVTGKIDVRKVKVTEAA